MPHGGTKNTLDCSADERDECKPSMTYLPAQQSQQSSVQLQVLSPLKSTGTPIFWGLATQKLLVQ